MSGVYPGLVSGDAFGEFGTGLWGLTQTPYTIMSYKRGYTNQLIDQNSQIYKDNASTPMALDVAAIQMKYGVNRQTRKGDSTYELNPQEWTCIYDAGGNDWVSARAGSNRQKKPLDASINLRPAEMNAIRPDSGQPMEKYEWTDNANFDLALNTLISMRTSMIGAPLGMSVVLAGKIDRVLFDETTGRKFRKKYDSSLVKLGKTLASLQEDQMIAPLQIVTSMRQYFDNYSFDDLEKFIPARLVAASPDFANLPEMVLEELILLLQESYNLVDTVSQLFPQTFTEDSGPESMAVYLAGLQDLQQEILARSGAGIAGYPMFFKGFNGGLTIAAGVIIENAEGGLGDDIIVGNAEDNQLVGGKGDDVLEGYFGADILMCGPDSGVYAYANAEDSSSLKKAVRDEINDFQEKDRLSL